MIIHPGQLPCDPGFNLTNRIILKNESVSAGAIVSQPGLQSFEALGLKVELSAGMFIPTSHFVAPSVFQRRWSFLVDCVGKNKPLKKFHFENFVPQFYQPLKSKEAGPDEDSFLDVQAPDVNWDLRST